MANKPAARTEHAEQVTVCQWLTANGHLFCSVPNGASYGKDQGARYRQAAWLKAEGLKKGFPDLLVFTSPDRCVGVGFDSVGVAIEMKRTKGGSLTPDQKGWIQALELEGWRVIVGRGANNAIEQLQALGYGPEK